MIKLFKKWMYEAIEFNNTMERLNKTESERMNKIANAIFKNSKEYFSKEREHYDSLLGINESEEKNE